MDVLKPRNPIAEFFWLSAARATTERLSESDRSRLRRGLSIGRQRAEAAEALWSNGHSAEGLRLAREAFEATLSTIEPYGDAVTGAAPAEAKTEAPEVKPEAPESKTEAPAEAAESTSDEAEAKSEAAESTSDEAESKAEEADAEPAESTSDEAESKAEEADAEPAEPASDEAESTSDEAEAKPESPSDEAESKAEEVDAEPADAESKAEAKDEPEAKTEPEAPTSDEAESQAEAPAEEADAEPTAAKAEPEAKTEAAEPKAAPEPAADAAPALSNRVREVLKLRGMSASRIADVDDVARALRAADIPQWDEEIKPTHGELFQRLVTAQRRIDSTLNPGVLAKREILWARVTRVGGAALIVLAAAIGSYLALRTPPGVNVTASAQWSPDYGGPELALDGDTNTEWQTPNNQNGWLQITIEPPTAVETLRILNGHNRQYNDRAMRSATIEIYDDGELARTIDQQWPRLVPNPEWNEYEIGLQEVDKIRVEVHSFHGNGAALAEIEWE